MIKKQNKTVNVDALSNKAVILAKLNKYEEAIVLHNKVLSLQPNHVQSLNGKGAYHANHKKDYSKAITFYERALNINSSYIKSLSNMGVAFAGLQKYDEALKWYDKSLVLESDAGTLYNKGNSLMNLRHYEDAIRSYNKALQLKPNSISTLLNKSRAHWYLEDYKNVLDCLRKAEKLQPKNKRVTIFLTEYHNFKHEVELWRGQIWREQISS